jgi:hypothetical protein
MSVDGGLGVVGGGSAGGREVTYVVGGWSSSSVGSVGDAGIARAARTEGMGAGAAGIDAPGCKVSSP